MEIFGIGLPEVVLILLLALVIMGPRDMTDSARKFARWVYRLFHSDQFREFIGAAREAREMPKQLIREAGLEEELAMLRKANEELRGLTRDTQNQVRGIAREATGEIGQIRQEIQPAESPKESTTDEHKSTQINTDK